MDSISINLVRLIRLTLADVLHDRQAEPAQSGMPGDTDWKAVFELAQKCSIFPIVYLKAKKLMPETEECKALAVSYFQPIVLGTLAQEKKLRLLSKVLEAFDAEGILARPFKGPVLADLYPDYRMRYSCDTDIYVDIKDRDRAGKILESCGFEYRADISEDNVGAYVMPGKLSIELHNFLWGDHTGKRIDILKSLGLTDRTVSGTYCGQKMSTLGYTEQLILLVFHFAKHLTLEQAHIRFLTDIVLYFEKYHEYIDISELREKLGKLKYWDFFCLIERIGQQYLGMPVRYGDILESFESETLEATLEELLCINVTEFDTSVGKWDFFYNMEPYMLDEYDRSATESAGKRKLTYIFPSWRDFPEKYSYVRRHPILLPIGWIQRFIDYGAERISGKSNRIAGVDRMNKIDRKVEMLKVMQLIEK